jgi:hypothetical protein
MPIPIVKLISLWFILLYSGFGHDAPSLECSDIVETNFEHAGDPSQASVAYRCRDQIPEPVGLGYTKYCQASSAESNFTCYGLAGGTYFNLFLQQAEAS